MNEVSEGYWPYFHSQDLGFVFRVDKDRTIHVAGVRPGSPASRLGISHSWRLLVLNGKHLRADTVPGQGMAMAGKGMGGQGRAWLALESPMPPVAEPRSKRPGSNRPNLRRPACLRREFILASACLSQSQVTQGCTGRTGKLQAAVPLSHQSWHASKRLSPTW